MTENMTDTTAAELGSEDAEACLQLYCQYGWWDDREHGDVEQALENTPLAVGLREDDELVAAARVLTDFVYYAKVYDVVVAESRRGESLGEQLMDAIIGHPNLADVNPTLMCRTGLVEFYESCGFEPYPKSVEVPEDGCEELRELVYKR